MTVSKAQPPTLGNISGMAIGGLILGTVAHPVFLAFFVIGFLWIFFGPIAPSRH